MDDTTAVYVNFDDGSRARCTGVEWDERGVPVSAEVEPHGPPGSAAQRWSEGACLRDLGGYTLMAPS